MWGTCAGAILLSQAVENTKKGGQEVLGGMSITIARNGWGSQVRLCTLSGDALMGLTCLLLQVESFEARLQVEGLRDPDEPFTGVFIRAPVRTSPPFPFPPC